MSNQPQQTDEQKAQRSFLVIVAQRMLFLLLGCIAFACGMTVWFLKDFWSGVVICILIWIGECLFAMNFVPDLEKLINSQS